MNFPATSVCFRLSFLHVISLSTVVVEENAANIRVKHRVKHNVREASSTCYSGSRKFECVHFKIV